ncbi:MAG: hypothetical protein AAGN66_15775 [Acidobacteriota bacterium]
MSHPFDRDPAAGQPAASPFTVGETGEVGTLEAYADFTCPKCGRHTRFTVRDETADGGFRCPHCGLEVSIRGTTLSDYQAQLDQLNASVRDFAADAKARFEKAAERLVKDAEGGHDPKS